MKAPERHYRRYLAPGRRAVLAGLSGLLYWGCTTPQVQAPLPTGPGVMLSAASPMPSTSPSPGPQPSARTRIDTSIEIIQPTPEPSESPAGTSHSSPTPIPSHSAAPLPPAASPTPKPTASPSRASSAGSSSSGHSNSAEVVSVSIRQTAIASVDKGQALKLYGFATLGNGKTSNSIKWASSDSGIASIDATGLVHGTRVGTVVITATSAVDPNKSTQMTLAVTNPYQSFAGKIVYARENDLYLMEGSNANPVRLTYSDDDIEVNPRFNWTGNKIAFRLGGPLDIGIIDLDGDRQVQRYDVSAENAGPLPFYWYSDNLLYQNFDPNGVEFWGLYMQRPNGTTRVITHDIGRVGTFAGVTPNGLIYFERNGEIRSYQANTPGTMHSYDFGDIPKMATNSSPRLVVYANADSHIATLGIDDNVIKVLTGPDTYDIFPALSPDEQHIVFSSKRDGGRHDLFMMNVDGTNVVNLTNTDEIDETLPDWGN